MARVFLSSVSEDRPAMRRLAEALRRAGHEPRIDVEWIEVDGMNTDEARIGELATSNPGEEAIERSAALIIGYSTTTERKRLRWHYLGAFWTAAAARKPALVVRFDGVPLPEDLTGVHVFDLHRDSWDRDMALVLAAIADPTAYFIDREAELVWLRNHVRGGAPVAVVGESGVGKSALIAEYALRHASEYGHYQRIFSAGQDRVARWEVSSPSGRDAPSLLVLDDTDVAKYATGIEGERRNAHIIVTARTRPSAFPGAVLELGALPPGDAALLFERRAGPPRSPAEIQERIAIVAAAGRSPRALMLAANLYRRGWRLPGTPATVAPLVATAAPPNSSERSLLEGALPFSPEPVPISWAETVGGVSSEPEAIAAARSLEDSALARLVLIGEPEIHLHPAVHQALRKQLTPEAQRALRGRAEEITTRWLTDALAHSPVADEQRLEHAAVLAGSDNESASPWHGALQERLAELHRRRGDRDQALQLLERAAHFTALHHSTHGDLHAIVLARRAALLDEVGDREQARRAVADAVAAAQSQAMNAPLRWRDIDPAAYEQAIAAAIELAERYDAPGHAARAAFLLADFHGRRGAWERASPLAEQALRAARRTDEPILVARAYRLLADAALHGSRYEDARASYEEAIRRMDELGADELAATSRLLYISLLLQLNRPEPAIGHARWLRTYLDRAPPSWPYRAEAEQTLRLFAESGTETDR